MLTEDWFLDIRSYLTRYKTHKNFIRDLQEEISLGINRGLQAGLKQSLQDHKEKLEEVENHLREHIGMASHQIIMLSPTIAGN